MEIKATNPLDELITKVRFLLPTAILNSDYSSTTRSSHFLTIRVAHALILIVWRPGEYFRVHSECDKGYNISMAEAEFGESINDVVDYLIEHIIKRGLV